MTNLDEQIIDILDLLNHTFSDNFVKKWRFKYSERFIKLFQKKLIESLHKKKEKKVLEEKGKEYSPVYKYEL